MRYAFKQVRASRKEHPNVSSWEKKQLGSAALPAPTTNRHTGVQFVSEHKVCFFLFFYVRAAQCVLSVVTNCSSTLTWWLSIRSSPLRWKVTSPKADGGFGAERDPGLLTRGWRTWQEVESASQQLSKGEGDGWRARDVQRSAFRSLHGSSRKRKKKKALIHWHIKGRQTQSSLQINAHYSQNEPLHNLSTWTQVLENGMCSVGKLEAYWWKWRCQKERIIANRFERGQLSVAVLINLYAFSCRKAKSCAVMFCSRCFWWCGSLMWPLKTCCPAQMMW